MRVFLYVLFYYYFNYAMIYTVNDPGELIARQNECLLIVTLYYPDKIHALWVTQSDYQASARQFGDNWLLTVPCHLRITQAVSDASPFEHLRSIRNLYINVWQLAFC